MILAHNDLTKDPSSRNFVHIEVHTQLHSATRVVSKFKKSIWKTKYVVVVKYIGSGRRFRKKSDKEKLTDFARVKHANQRTVNWGKV